MSDELMGYNSDEVVTLDGIKEGVWRVYTETSMYLLHLDVMQGRRFPGSGLGQMPGTTEMPDVAALREDENRFKLISVECEIGKPMELLIQGLTDPSVITWRRSTFVRRIEKLDMTGVEDRIKK